MLVGQNLKQIGADLLVRAVPGQLLGQLRDPLAGVGQRLGARYQLPLCAFPTADQLAGIQRSDKCQNPKTQSDQRSPQVGHQVGNFLGRCNDLVVRVVPLLHLHKEGHDDPQVKRMLRIVRK